MHHYGIRGIANNWLKLSLVNRNQYTYIDENNSTPHHISYGVPQGSVLELFILFLNKLHISVKRSKVHHFVENTNLLLINKLHKKINKLVNRDLALLVKWLRSNKILHCLINKELNFLINGQRINTCKPVKYLGVTLH